jgi:hypothetical protein
MSKWKKNVHKLPFANIIYMFNRGLLCQQKSWTFHFCLPAVGHKIITIPIMDLVHWRQKTQ